MTSRPLQLWPCANFNGNSIGWKSQLAITGISRNPSQTPRWSPFNLCCVTGHGAIKSFKPLFNCIHIRGILGSILHFKKTRSQDPRITMQFKDKALNQWAPENILMSMHPDAWKSSWDGQRTPGEFRVTLDRHHALLPYQVTVEGLWQALIVQHDWLRKEQFAQGCCYQIHRHHQIIESQIVDCSGGDG